MNNNNIDDIDALEPPPNARPVLARQNAEVFVNQPLYRNNPDGLLQRTTSIVRINVLEQRIPLILY